MQRPGAPGSCRAALRLLKKFFATPGSTEKLFPVPSTRPMMSSPRPSDHTLMLYAAVLVDPEFRMTAPSGRAAAATKATVAAAPMAIPTKTNLFNVPLPWFANLLTLAQLQPFGASSMPHFSPLQKSL